jgi:ACS family glucarate transporter-like MFS transporter
MAVVTMATLLGMVTYLDRACIGTLDKPILHDLDLTVTVWGRKLTPEFGLGCAYMAFALAYCAFGIPSARWADRIGTRTMLTAVVVAWSLCTFATGLAQGMVSLIVIRLLFGMGESGAWPAITRTLSRWIPYRERGTAQGVVWIGGHITAGVTPLLIDQLMRGTSWHGLHLPPLSWREVFVLLSMAGLIWAAVWYWWFRDEPEQHAKVNPAELAHIVSGRTAASSDGAPRGWAFWRRLLTHPSMIALCLMYLPNSFIFYFCITWFHRYLEEGRGLEGRTLAFFTGLPLLLSVLADVLGGTTTDWAVRRFGPRWGRAGVGLASYLTAGICVLLAGLIGNPLGAAWLFALGNAANMLMMGAGWGTCQDIGGGHAGTVSATMNTAGQLGAMTCPLLVIFLKDHYGWNRPLVFIGLSFLVASISWLFIDPRNKVFD